MCACVLIYILELFYRFYRTVLYRKSPVKCSQSQTLFSLRIVLEMILENGRTNRGTNSASYTKLVSLCTPFVGLY